jgi:hypothetical protein
MCTFDPRPLVLLCQESKSKYNPHCLKNSPLYPIRGPYPLTDSKNRDLDIVPVCERLRVSSYQEYVGTPVIRDVDLALDVFSEG